MRKTERKQVGDRNEIQWIDDLVGEHERGIEDHGQRLTWLIATIEREHEHTPELERG